MKCPLCQQKLLEINLHYPGGVDYLCRNRVRFYDHLATVPHYEHRADDCVYWYIPPYQIIIHPDKTRVEILPENQAETFTHKYLTRSSFQHVFTINEPLHPDTPENILKRIKLLQVLS